jgi:hypothetical protein
VSACPQCGASVTPGPRPKTYCSTPCQSKAADARRATTRAGRSGITNPQAEEPPTRPLSPTLIATPPSVDMAASDRLSVLMDKAHSRVGVNAWEVAEIAKLRGISPWSPLAKIIAR